jgi:hypothetical protein
MVRAGLVMYGCPPCPGMPFEVRPALSWLTEVSYVKWIESGECVSYGCTFRAERKTCVATLAVGYGDGYHRALSGKGEVLIRGVRCPIIGRVCMDQMMVDATEVCDVQIGDQAVLIGKQGIYKTTWLERLIPPHLRQYCCKLANSTQLNKDDRLRIAEFGLINMDELDAMTPRELNSIKSVITASDVNERAAYGYTKERRMRLASFCASSNRREFLTDITGNRRWLPFEVESIQNPFFTTLPYDLMYAQAWALASDPNFSYWFELDEIAVLEQHNEDYRVQDSEEQLLPILFDIPAEGKGEFMTTAQISERLVTYGNIKKPMAVSRLGMLLGQAGYRAVTRGERGSRMRGWIVYQRDTEEIATNKKLLAKECVTV